MDKTNLRKVIIDQKQEITDGSLQTKIIKRGCFARYKQYVESPQIKVITGIRRCGKSVLSMQLLKDKSFAYINFDDEKLARLTVDDLNDVLEVFYEMYGDFKYILLDEIQNISGWELFVNRLHRQGFNVIVTGSNAHLLSKELATHLTGRHISLELFPFSFKEFLDYHDLLLRKIDLLSTKERGVLKEKLDQYISTGGFPEVLKGVVNKNQYLQALYLDIINKDIIIRHKIRLYHIIKDMASNLMSNIASLVSFNKLKNIYQLKSAHTARNYLSFLEESFLFFLVERFSYKSKERSIANRKIYAIDMGMKDAVSMDFSKNMGRKYENTVFLELLRNSSLHKIEIYYWQDIYKHEVDFAVKKGNKITQLIQVCYDLTNYDTKKRELHGLIMASKELKCKKLIVITYDYEAYESIENIKIEFIPLWKWLLA